MGMNIVDLLSSFLVVQDNSVLFLYLVLIVGALTQQIGSAFNVSFLWIEMSASKQVFRIKNIEKTKYALLAIESLLVASCVTSVAVFKNISALMVPAGCFMILIGISFAWGSSLISKALAKGTQFSVNNTAEIRIVSTARAIAFDISVILINGVLYAVSFVNRSSPLGFLSMFVLKMSALHMFVVILIYVEGKQIKCSELYQLFARRAAGRQEKSTRVFVLVNVREGNAPVYPLK